MKMSEEDFDKVVDTKLKGTFNCIRFVTRTMLRQKSGHIINMSSVVGVAGMQDRRITLHPKRA